MKLMTVEKCEFDCESTNKLPFLLFFVHTKYLHSSKFSLDFACPIGKSNTFLAFQLVANTSPIGKALH